MIKIENSEVVGWEHAIRGMRNPKNSWDRTDSFMCREVEEGECPDGCTFKDNCPIYGDEEFFVVGPNDRKLMMQLAAGGPVHAKYRRMIAVYVDITAPLYWWKEFDTYKVGTVANSCSTMHKIHDKRFEREDFSIEHLENLEEQHWMVCMDNVIASLNVARERFLETKDKKYWWQMIQLLPSSYNQKRTIMLNYEVLVGMYRDRKNHKLDCWHTFCEWIESLPYSELITGNKEGN